MFEVIKSKHEILSWRKTLEHKSLGFVPTMGNLHLGHLSLLEQSLKHNDVSVISIFVNPTQFGPQEDFAKYPRTFHQDVALIQQHFPQQPVVIFAPANQDEVYPLNPQTTLINRSLGSELEGKIRPHHFEGVLTVVFHLFRLISPDKAYFGLKDYQQFILIRKMVDDLNLDVQIIGCPIVRDTDGLALSSRNQYLSPKDREEALDLPRSLDQLSKLIKDQGLQGYIQAKEDLLRDKRWNYIELRDAETLSPEITSSRAVLLAVYEINGTRLLDNRILEL